MLVAEIGGERLEAARDLARDELYRCPNCSDRVVLKRGPIVVPHFAHMPGSLCQYGVGETPAHMRAKVSFCAEFRARGLRAELEYTVETLPGDRRADVMVWSPTNHQYAIELQHTAIGLEEITARAAAYARVGIHQTWIPVLTKLATRRDEEKSDLCVPKYSPRPFEKWIHGFYLGHIWVWDASAMRAYGGRYGSVLLEVTGWDEESHESYHAGWRHSKRWRRFVIDDGPVPLADLRLGSARRTHKTLSHYQWPAANLGILSVNR
jgi:DNA-directed RNA polymerase subunit RPC12/RpoP